MKEHFTIKKDYASTKMPNIILDAEDTDYAILIRSDKTNIFSVTLGVVGNTDVKYNDTLYTSPEDFPEELIKFIKEDTINFFELCDVSDYRHLGIIYAINGETLDEEEFSDDISKLTKKEIKSILSDKMDSFVEKNYRLSEEDICFEPNSTIDFEYSNSADYAAITEYLWATDKLCELVGLRDFEKRHNLKLSDTGYINLYFVKAIYDWEDEEWLDKKYVEAVIVSDDKEISRLIEQDFGSVSPILTLSDAELRLIESKVIKNFNYIHSDETTWAEYLTECKNIVLDAINED